ncbi:MAG: hypothetical protein KDE34_00320, partial [Anaerolineales bacterium]|nr:hypothetical protein [Anaerolineales bacterium]
MFLGIPASSPAIRLLRSPQPRHHAGEALAFLRCRWCPTTAASACPRHDLPPSLSHGKLSAAIPSARTNKLMSQPLPFTGAEYLQSLQDDREVWIYGRRVADVSQHPAFRNSARMVAR